MLRRNRTSACPRQRSADPRRGSTPLSRASGVRRPRARRIPPSARRSARTLGTPLLACAACASSTPPTGTWAGRSTGWGCSTRRRRSSTTSSSVVRAERVDAVLVAGDVYDRALPSRRHRRRCSTRRWRRLVDAGAQVVLSSGNHDSAAPARVRRSAAGARPGVHVRTGSRAMRGARAARRRAGTRSPSTRCPTSSPPLVGRCSGCRPAPATRRCSARRWRAIRADLAARPAGTRRVVAAHAFVVGRRAQRQRARHQRRRGRRRCRPAVFDGVDYVALGHLHGRQRLDRPRPLPRVAAGLLLLRGRPSARAPGWSSSAAAGSSAVDAVDAPVPRPLAVLRGRLDDLLDRPASRRRTSRPGAR